LLEVNLLLRSLFSYGGHCQIRTGVHGFAGRCVTTPPSGHHNILFSY
jgi:hypothetical protein